MKGSKQQNVDKTRQSSPVGLIIRQKEPTNLEMPFDQLDSYLTPTELFYIRSHFPVPTIDVAGYRLRIDGAVRYPLGLSYRELREMPSELHQISYPTMGPPDRVDWVDYAQRNAKDDPKALAQQALDMAGPDHSIFVVWSGTYKTFEGQCEDFVNAISAQRPLSETIGTDDSTQYFEHANVAYFAPKT